MRFVNTPKKMRIREARPEKSTRVNRMGGVLFLILCLIWISLLAACTHQHQARPYDGVYGHLLHVYHEPLNHLNAVRRGACPMHPSCSEYSRQAIAKHGFFPGWTMAMDRLIRCGRDEIRRAPVVIINGEKRFYDPVSSNDDWLSSAKDDVPSIP